MARGEGAGGFRPVAFSSRSSPLQIWASIIIDPARVVGGWHFLPFILGRVAGPDIFIEGRVPRYVQSYGLFIITNTDNLGAIAFNETGRAGEQRTPYTLAQSELVMILYHVITTNGKPLWYCRRAVSASSFRGRADLWYFVMIVIGCDDNWVTSAPIERCFGDTYESLYKVLNLGCL